MHLKNLIVFIIVSICFIKPIKSYTNSRDNFEASNVNEPNYRIPIGKLCISSLTR